MSDVLEQGGVKRMLAGSSVKIDLNGADTRYELQISDGGRQRIAQAGWVRKYGSRIAVTQ